MPRPRLVPRPSADPVDILLPDDAQDLVLDARQLRDRLRTLGRADAADLLAAKPAARAKLLVERYDLRPDYRALSTAPLE